MGSCGICADQTSVGYIIAYYFEKKALVEL
jgi:hypothetical protein